MKTGKNVVITGVTSGIGQSTAKRFVNEGHNVIGCGRREKRLNELSKDLGGTFTGIPADLGTPDGVDSLFSEISSNYQDIDLLVNNAGVGYELSLIDGDRKHWIEMININLTAVALCCAQALPGMVKRNSGHIVTVSSMSGHRVTPGGGMYAATKHGVRALMEGIRQDLAHRNSDVRVSMVSPGFVETEFYNAYYHDKPEERANAFTTMKALQSEDVAEAISYTWSAPPHVGINDILMRPLQQTS